MMKFLKDWLKKFNQARKDEVENSITVDFHSTGGSNERRIYKIPIGKAMSDKEIESLTLFKKQITEPINLEDLPILPENNEHLTIKFKQDYYL